MGKGFGQFPKIFLQTKNRWRKNCASTFYCLDLSRSCTSHFNKNKSCTTYSMKQFHAPENCLTPYPSRNNGQSLSQLKKFSYGSTEIQHSFHCICLLQCEVTAVWETFVLMTLISAYKLKEIQNYNLYSGGHLQYNDLYYNPYLS